MSARPLVRPSARPVQNNRLVARKTAIAQLVAQLFVGGAMLGAAMPASAASCTWNPALGNWNATVNWLACTTGNGNPAATPGAADSATIGAAKTVIITTGQSILNLSNAGTVNIDAFGLNLAGGGSTTNTGTLNVGGPSTANIGVSGGHNINNTGGTINIAAGSVVNQFGSSITGGTIGGAGDLAVFGSGSNFLNGVTLGGRMDMAVFALQRVTNGLTLNSAVNSATIDLANGSVLSFEDTSILAGTGSIVLGAAGGVNNRVYFDGNGTTTFAAGVTVRGHSGTIGGQININGTQVLVNNGTISADVASGTINITESAVTNNGTLSALNGGTLMLSSNVSGGAGGQIVAGAGSTVLQNGVTISGTINTSGSGQFRPSGASSNFLDGATLNGNLDMASNFSLERVTAGGLVLNGTINLANSSVLSFEGNGGLSGNGTIVLGSVGGSNNRIYMDGNGTTTFASGTTIRGENGTIGGQLNLAGTQTIVNNGTISADVAGGTINITESAVTNNGTLSALNGGLLLLSSNVSGGAGGQIVAGAGSTVLQNGVTISGTINTSGSGQFRASGISTNFLDGATLNGNLDMASAFALERVTAGGLVLNGTINLANASVLSFEGNGGLSGNGTIVLGSVGGSNNRIYMDGNGTTTFAAGTTVRGHSGTIGGQLNINGTQTIVNNGTISADVAGGTINITESAVINNGTLSALNGGILTLSSNVTGGALGQIVAGVGSTVLQNGVTISGTINTSGSGIFRPTASASNFLDGVTLNGNLDMATSIVLERVTAGGLVLNGTINLDNASVLSFEGNGGLSGNGTIVLGSLGGSNNRVFMDGNGTTTFAAGTTIRGYSGTIGGQVFTAGTQTIVNNGTISADVAGGIITFTESALVNNGLVRAQAGTMNVGVALSGTGTLQVDATGVMNLAAGAKTQGTLAMGATGAAINLNTGNLTLTTDYTNIGALIGNSFNRRAGVTGAGLIVAGGNAAQAITGAGVTNGNTANATLTLGNMRVGATTYNYQVANTGTTGPSLRGAIQTNVNGGNLTDPRLTGAGVTASNYNTGAPGSNTGNLAVTFTSPSAGLLAPLSGQALNLRSNFENIADQKLNIVLAAGAAAYNAALGLATPSPVTVANQRVGGTNTAALTVTNAAAAGAFSEDLNATFGTSTGLASGAGSIAGRLAGSNNTGTGAMTASVNTATAGAKTGTVTLNYETAGAVAGVSNGLGVASVGSQIITVNGNVYQVAQPTALPTTVALGNFRAGTPQSQTVNLTNSNISPAGFQEGLNATIGTFTGAATGTGSLSNVAAGSSGNLQIGVTGVAGVNTGSVQVQLATNGTGTSGLGNLNLGAAQTISVSGTGYRLAQPNSIAPINFGNVLANTVQTRTVSISNGATADGFSEALNAAFGIVGGTNAASFSGAGAINGLLAGGSNNTNMVVTLNTSAAGTKTANIQILLDSNGTAIGNGLGLTALPTQTINLDGVITGVVGNLASAGLSPTTVNFGKFREGAANQTQQLTVSNLTSGPGEGLNASFGAASGSASNNGGSIAALATGGTNNTSMSVSLGGLATAGAKSGTQALNFVSDGSFNAGVPTPLPSQNVALSAEVYRLAAVATTTVTPSITLAARVGGAAPSSNISITNNSVDGFTEGLNVTRGATAAGFTSSGGPITNLAANASSSAVGVTLNTGTAGTFSGNQVLALASNGTITGNSDVASGNVNVALNGKVYSTAVVQVNTASPINFGIVHVGDVVALKNVSLTNNTDATALGDRLVGSISAAGPFSGSGTLGAGLAANATDATSLKVGLNTATAGVFNAGIANLSLVSHNPDMADLNLVTAPIGLTAQVNNYANLNTIKVSGLGSFSRSGNVFTLDFGNVLVGSGVLSAGLNVLNDVAGPADEADGSYCLPGMPCSLDALLDFALSGFGDFNDVGAGGTASSMTVALSTAALGQFQDEISLAGFGHNASGFRGALNGLTLLIRGNVIDPTNNVPEPGTLSLLLMAAAGAVLARRRKARLAA